MKRVSFQSDCSFKKEAKHLMCEGEDDCELDEERTILDEKEERT